MKAVVAVSSTPANEPVNDPVILEPATVEVLVKVPIEMLGVWTKPAATVENEALSIAPANDPVNDDVMLFTSKFALLVIKGITNISLVKETGL